MQASRTDRPSTRRCRPYRALAATLLLVACALAASGLNAAPAIAADFTWSGGGGSGSTIWSNGANWLGGSAPSNGASIGTLSFPALSGLTLSDNDLTGVSVEHLAVDNGRGFGLSGNALTLGSGGLSLAADEHPPIFATNITAPLTLSASQTWSLSAPAAGNQYPAPEDFVSFQGQLTGESANLTINLNALSQVAFGSFFEEHAGPNDELGNVVVNGSNTVVPITTEEGEPIEVTYKDGLSLPGGLNGSDGHRLTLNDVELSGNGPTGPITANGTAVGLRGAGIGAITSSGSKVEVNGQVAAVTLDSASALDFLIESEGSTPGTDYDQLTSTGAISLGGAALRLSSFQGAHNVCPRPPIGQVYTLLSTTGSLTGAFRNVGSGGTATAECIDTSHGITIKVYSYRITLNTGGATKTITATALPAVPTSYEEEPVPPTISGTAVQGQTLSEAHGIWSNEPTSYGYQWERCNSAGSGCAAIAGATAPSYPLSAGDVGSTIRVAETASNSEGTSAPMVSSLSAIVQAAGSNPAPSSTGTSGSSATNIAPTITAPVAKALTLSAAQLAALLIPQLVPHGMSATIGSLLKHGGLTMPFTVPEAGALTVRWYFVPKGAKLAKHAKPMLVASGVHAFGSAGTGVVKLKLTSMGKRALRQAHRLPLATRVTFTPIGAGGAPVVATGRFIVRR